MAERDWLRPESLGEAAGNAWVTRPQARFELRPLSLGELLDRTFALYRSRFWLFAGIAMIAAAVYTVSVGISLATAHRLVAQIPTAAAQTPLDALANLRTASVAQTGTYIALLVFFLVNAVIQAATAWAVAQVYLDKPVEAQGALRKVGPRWLHWIGIALWQMGSLVWIPLAGLLPAVLLLAFGARSNSTGLVVIGGLLALLAVFGGVPAGVIFYLRNALAVPAAVMEGLPIRAAMRRSKALAAGTKGRIFVVVLIAGALLEVVAVLQAPVTVLMLMAPNQEHYLARGLAMLTTFVGHTVVMPVLLIGLTLVYFDQRVRKEALDLQLLLDEAGGTGAVELERARPETDAQLG